MRCDDIEKINSTNNINSLSHTNFMNKKELKQNKKKLINATEEKKSNKILFIAIILLPIFSFISLISFHSNMLINERISIFSQVWIGLLLIALIIGIIKEIKIKRRLGVKMMKLGISILYVSIFVVVAFLLYGDNSSVRDYIISKAMSTTNHQYIAEWFFDTDMIDESLLQLKEATQVELDGSEKFSFDEVNYNQAMYDNEYEEQILDKENVGDLYKIINIEGTTIGADYKYKGYLVVVYDPSKVKLGVSTGAGIDSSAYGEILSTIAQKNKAVVAMNAGGFYDPYWNSNGGIPHGPVIQDGKILTDYTRANVSGGIIGFNYEDELILKRMTAEEAVASGIRDAVDWGPYLIINGVNQYKNVTTYSWATSRTTIGQRKDGIVLMLVIDGGNQPGSYGASYADVAKIMEQYGAINAANLDGGTSTALVENGEYVNNPWNGTKRTIRRLPNAWIVVE